MAASSQPLDPRVRLALATLFGVVGGAFAQSGLRRGELGDFAQIWFAARTLVHGGNPYALIGPGRAFPWDWPLYYPATAVVAAFPLTLVDRETALTLVAGLGCAALAWTLLAHGYASLLAFASISVWQAVHLIQWSPLLAGAVGIAPLSIILAAKPTVGAAVFAARPTWWALVGGVGLVALAFLVDPSWVSTWHAALASPNVTPGKAFKFLAPITQLGGVFVLAALTRWRRPEARLLVVLACVPQTMLPYETVLLFLVPRGGIEVSALVLLSHLSVRWVVHLHPLDMATTTAAYARVLTLLLYLPAAVMILRRPNEGDIPAWLSDRINRWPGWLRGGPALRA